MTRNGGLGGERQGKARKVNEEKTSEEKSSVHFLKILNSFL